MVVSLEHAGSGRVLELYSDQPTLHVVTGRYLPEAGWQQVRALPMPRHEPALPCATYEAWHESTTPPLRQASPVWSAGTCSVILSSSSGSSCDWPIAKPRNRWDKATSTSSLARMLEAATSTHLSFRDRATSMSPLKPPPIDLLGGDDIPPPPEPPPDPDELEAERQRELEQRWEEEDRQWHDGEPVVPESEVQHKRIPGINGVLYYRFGGIELATQGFPDAVNRGQFPSCILRSGEVYKRTTIYYFSTLPKTEAELKEETDRQNEAETKQMEAEEARLLAEVEKKLEQVQALGDIPEEPEE
ncbi:uncharacterized protein LOC126285067 [Schistocerca gregaria]|uniref:uncharacterized protein LOC126285067 n=1 Tax=Schistocerca gregaria TaxID=7010 RepID=UPI00211E90EF|nr:uncharacterized protein LOC126285067 [Schistocerca gregaria]